MWHDPKFQGLPHLIPPPPSRNHPDGKISPASKTAGTCSHHRLSDSGPTARKALANIYRQLYSVYVRFIYVHYGSPASATMFPVHGTLRIHA